MTRRPPLEQPKIHRLGIEYIDYNQMYSNFYRNAGSSDMVVNGSVTPVEFSITVPDGWDILAFKTSIHIIDTNVHADEFGSIPALTNGLRFYLKDPDGLELLDFLAGETVKINGDLAAFAGFNVSQMGTRGIVADWVINESTGGRAMRLRPGYSLNILIQDNLSALTHMEATIQGVILQTL